MAVTARKVIDGQSEASRDELIAAIEARRVLWQAAVAKTAGREEQPGVAGGWTLRDVIAHINFYLRFHVLNLGGPARAFDDMPQEVGADVEKRNQWAHEQDRSLEWTFVRDEGDELHRELIRQLAARSDEDVQAPLVNWHPWPLWRWMCDVRNHYDEHQKSLEAWLAARPERSDQS